jgi:FlaA1/EpsC-like NDP-sugar epimerase
LSKLLKDTIHKIWQRRLVLVHDVLAIPLAWFGAYLLRFNLTIIPPSYFEQAVGLLPVVMLIQLTTYVYSKSTNGVWRYISMPDMIRIIKSIAYAIILLSGLFYYSGQISSVPRSLLPLYALLLCSLLCGSRLIYRRVRETSHLPAAVKRVLIVGAGQAGEGLVRDLLRHRRLEYQPIAFVDNSKRKIGQEIHGISVVARCNDIPNVVVKQGIDLIMIAVPSANSAQMRAIVAACEQAQVPFFTLPSLQDLTSGLITVNAMREVSLEDLLGRDQVELDWDGVHQTIRHQVILVTGAGGSIGSELCRQIALRQPACLLILDNSEFNLYTLELELSAQFPHLRMITCLGDVLDDVFLENIFTQYHPQLVFHAAAYKHVPMLETHCRQAVMNNVIGTHRLATLAVAHHVKKFVLISTDKAVNPSSVMGATKRLAEIICQHLNQKHSTQFITVRFGNVLGSTGSVVPLFRKQLARGGPLTVTHPDMTRYFMTIPEAAQLILQANVLGCGGEIFVLDMGEPIKISYLAEQMIRLSGREVNKDIAIEYTGLRPGEKLVEELFQTSEEIATTEHEKILKAIDAAPTTMDLDLMLNRLSLACSDMDDQTIIATMRAVIPNALFDDRLSESIQAELHA